MHHPLPGGRAQFKLFVRSLLPGGHASLEGEMGKYGCSQISSPGVGRSHCMPNCRLLESPVSHSDPSLIQVGGSGGISCFALSCMYLLHPSWGTRALPCFCTLQGSGTERVHFGAMHIWSASPDETGGCCVQSFAGTQHDSSYPICPQFVVYAITS